MPAARLFWARHIACAAASKRSPMTPTLTPTAVLRGLARFALHVPEIQRHDDWRKRAMERIR
jgi:hypothetical protein